MIQEIKNCRVCKNINLISCVDLGEQYFSTLFPEIKDHDKYNKYPLQLILCSGDRKDNCGLLQLSHELDLSSMYRNRKK